MLILCVANWLCRLLDLLSRLHFSVQARFTVRRLGGLVDPSAVRYIVELHRSVFPLLLEKRRAAWWGFRSCRKAMKKILPRATFKALCRGDTGGISGELMLKRAWRFEFLRRRYEVACRRVVDCRHFLFDAESHLLAGHAPLYLEVDDGLEELQTGLDSFIEGFSMASTQLTSSERLELKE